MKKLHLKTLHRDISNNDIATLFDSVPQVNQQPAHFSNEMKAYEAVNFGEAIKIYYQMIEVETPHYLNYECLRHGLKYSKLDNGSIDHLQTDFGIYVENPSGRKYINIGDPNGRAALIRTNNE